MSEGRYQDSLTLIRQVHEMAAQLGLGDVISDCLTLEAQVVRALGEDWTVPMWAALQVAHSGGYEFRAYNAFLFLYLLYCADLRNDEAEQIFNDALAYCDLHDVGKPCLLAERAGVLEKLGRWDECASTVGAVLDERKVTRANRMQSLSILAKVMARRGQDGYWQYLDEARDSSIGLEEPEWLIFVGLARVEAYWLEGRLDAARAELDRIRGASVGLAVPYRRWLALWTRRLTGAAELVDLEPFASHVAGNAAHAAELWDRLGYRYEAALALLDTKEEANLRESLTRLVDLGADAAARVVRRTMRDLGIRSIPAGARTATRAHPRGLTAREQEILQLLAKGNSNEEISGSLFISVRTVENHVSAILAKLGTDSRKGAAAEARRLGLTPQDRSPVATKSR